MSDLTSFRSIIELWPKREEMASELGAKPAAVSKWWQRDTIPSEWWLAILATDKAREGGVTADLLASLAARHVEMPDPELAECRL